MTNKTSVVHDKSQNETVKEVWQFLIMLALFELNALQERKWTVSDAAVPVFTVIDHLFAQVSLYFSKVILTFACWKLENSIHCGLSAVWRS